MSEDKNMSNRIPFLSREEALMRGREQGMDDYISQLNLFRVLLHYPDIAVELNKSILALVSSDAALSHRLRELIIMRIAWITKSVYEWTQHWQVSLLFGLKEDEIVAVKDWKHSDLFDDHDRIVLQATDDTLTYGSIQQGTWDALVVHLPDPESQITVVASIGNWLMFAQLLKSLDIPLEDGAEVWPPDGIGPAESAVE